MGMVIIRVPEDIHIEIKAKSLEEIRKFFLRFSFGKRHFKQKESIRKLRSIFGKGKDLEISEEELYLQGD